MTRRMGSGPPEEFLVVGGRQGRADHRKAEWHRYEEAVVLAVDGATGAASTCVAHVTPAGACAHEDDPSILFKAATLTEDGLYVCTQTEVLVYDLPEFRRRAYHSLPLFNDVHHVRPRSNGNLLVVVTGLDLVIELAPDGDVVREWGVLGQDPWERFDRAVDYRKVVTTKPHGAHPNFVFELENEVWTTRFEQRDAVCLTRPGDRIEVGVERPHDGVVVDGRVYFTTVDGRIVIADDESHEVLQIVDLNSIGDRSGGPALGWCRGLAVLDSELVVVGFSRLRPTRFRENLRWAGRGLGLSGGRGTMATRIACYDLAAGRLAWEVNLEERGMNVVFSVHPYPMAA